MHFVLSELGLMLKRGGGKGVRYTAHTRFLYHHFHAEQWVDTYAANRCRLMSIHLLTFQIGVRQHEGLYTLQVPQLRRHGPLQFGGAEEEFFQVDQVA